MTRRTVAVAAVLVLVAAVAVGFLASRGDDDPFAAYCEEVEEQQQPLTDALATDGTTGLLDALPSFRSLAGKAPDDIADDWAVVVERAAALAEAFEAADVDPATYDRRDPPEGLSEEDRDAIDAAARALVADDTGVAITNVQQQARDVCKTPLSL